MCRHRRAMAMTHLKFDFALDHAGISDAAALSGLQVGQCLVLQKQQAQEVAKQHSVEVPQVDDGAGPTTATAGDVAAQGGGHASAGLEAAGADPGGTSNQPGITDGTATASTAAPAPPPPPAVRILHVCDSAGHVLGVVPAATAKRLPPRVDLAAFQVRGPYLAGHCSPVWDAQSG